MGSDFDIVVPIRSLLVRQEAAELQAHVGLAAQVAFLETGPDIGRRGRSAKVVRS